MKRLILAGWLLSATAALLILFQIKQEVRELEQELRATHRAIVKEQENLHILQAEWSYLNRPERIARLAQTHLQLAPLTASQTVGFADLPWREETGPQDEKAPQNRPLRPRESPSAAGPAALLAQALRAPISAPGAQGEAQ